MESTYFRLRRQDATSRWLNISLSCINKIFSVIQKFQLRTRINLDEATVKLYRRIFLTF